MANFLDIINKKTTPEIVTDPNQLTIAELEYVLNTLKLSTLRGDQVELFYSLVVKLQNQYLALTNKK